MGTHSLASISRFGAVVDTYVACLPFLIERGADRGLLQILEDEGFIRKARV